MAEDNQELSMEDILSSIKNILSEDENSGKQQEEKKEPEISAPGAESDETQTPAETEKAEPSEPETANRVEEDDVLDLSPSMRIEDFANSEEEINLDAELDGISGEPENSQENLEAPAAAFEEEPEEGENELTPEKAVSTETEELPADDAQGLSEIEPQDEESDPFDVEKTENADYRETSYQEEPAKIMESAREPEIILPTLKEVEAEPYFEADAPQAPAYQQDEEPKKQPEPEPRDFRTDSGIEMPAEKNAVDVSASIISNFAKMFTREKAAEPEEQVEAAEPVRELGSANRTIEDVVASVIRRIIGEEVSQNWRKGADYDKLAREEIAEQTQKWLDKNLPALVERIVKQEIERVMAKVGDDR